MNPEQSAALRKPFPPEAIGKLPKAGITLDYVGHATTTDRLLTVDPEWSWEPLAYAEDGGPMIRTGKELTLWIRLTVCGVTRIGVGSVAPNAFDAEKQLVGDALRNAAMRFGVALDLWSKAELESEHVTKNTVTCPRCSFAAQRADVRSHLIESHGYVPDSTGKVHPPKTTDASSTGPTGASAAPTEPNDEGHDPSAGVGPSPVPPGEAGGGEATAHPDAPPPAPPARLGKRQQVLMRYAEAGLSDRTARLAHASEHLGREVTTFADLTTAEAEHLLDALRDAPVAVALEGMAG